MAHILQYKIADLHITLRSDIAMTNNAAWQKFLCSAAHSDHTYECHMHRQLPILPNGKHYYDQIHERDYAITEEFDNGMHIHLSEENLPWGSEVDQLYPQLALPHMLLQHQKLLLHASYIITERGAILFTAPSGTGKSTQAELWRAHRNAFIVNGDRAVIGLQGEIASAYGFPLSGSSPDCHNRTEKLLAVVALKQAKHNSVRRLSFTEAVPVFINGSYLPPEYQADLPQLVDTALQITKYVPIIELSCLPDEGAVAALESVL